MTSTSIVQEALEEKLGERRQLEILLVTGRSLVQGMSMEAEGKRSRRYRLSASTLSLNPEDAQLIGVEKNSRVRVETEHGAIVVNVSIDPGLPRGTGFIPMGPWANAVVCPLTDGTGMPKYKNIPAKVRPTEEQVPSVEELVSIITGRRVDAHPVELDLREGEKKIIEDFVCPFCGDLCDFIKVHLNGNIVEKVVGACPLGSSKIRNYHRDRIVKPYIRSPSGLLEECTLPKALDKAGEILSSSKHPLIFGLSSTVNEAIIVGVELAEYLGAIIDNTTVVCHGPTTIGVMEAGAARCTLGLVRHLADLILFWGCNPAEAHPNHFKRWVIEGGKHVKGRKDRRVIVIDVRRTATARMADEFIMVEPGKDYELITALRMAVKDLDIEQSTVAGVPREKIYELADALRSCKYGVGFFGMGLTMNEPRYRSLEELIKLAHDLNDWTRFTVVPMRGHYNVTGACQVSTWLTGYPFSVDFMRGIPKFIPGLTTATDALIRGDVDAALIIASDPVAHFPRKAVENLSKIPLIVVDPKWSLTAMIADVVIPSAMSGVEAGGTAYRMDGVPLRVKKIIEPPTGVMEDHRILLEILSRVRRLRGE